ncbi:ammonium transporter [Aeoliella sp. ICT_H6.2]|uniref:Ammonium transporter n=1 Tax=Aeoliella straminimaris TaxID=2954799 RepID=A0A9X2JIW0_9BACT|nr:ammonium transporter [Aeoliella straminimaris]MCO6047231.1 ammonium transporter [Aeoliella straminimaris]
MNLVSLQRLFGVLMLASMLALVLSPAVSYAQDDDPVAEVEVEETEVDESADEEATAEDETDAEDSGESVESEEEVLAALGENYDFAINTLLLFLSGVLVFFMQAGFAMVESGFNSGKNAVNILFKNSMDISVGVLLYYIIGFGLMYPGSYGDVENGYFAFGGVGLDGYALTSDLPYSPAADWFFQAMFAATAATIVSGAVAGRMKVGAYLIYSAILTGLIYPISGYWKWGGGWLMQFESGYQFQDFAGSAVVHAVGGFAGLAGAIVLGPRLGRYVDGKSIPVPGHNIVLAGLGVFILWFGWYGFNPGSQLTFSTPGDVVAVTNIAMTTTLAAGAGGIVATLVSWAMFGKPDLSMGLNGILGGLVGITACCDCMSYNMSILVGAIAGVLVIVGIMMLDKLKIDDPVGAWPVHGLCGLWGCLAIGILPNAHLVVNEETGISNTNFMTQLIGTLSIAAWAFVTMFILFSIMKAAGILRVSAEDEQAGLDISEHGMQAYSTH